MSLFTNELPTQDVFYAPDTAYGDKKTTRALAWMGRKADGSRNLFGKITSFIPGLGIAQDLSAKRIAQEAGYEDTAGNVQADQANTIQRMLLGLNIGKSVVMGAINPASIPGSINSLAQSAVGIAGSKTNYNTQGTTQYFARGGTATKVDPEETQRVINWQQRLNKDLGLNLKLDGKWGTQTQKAFEDYQANQAAAETSPVASWDGLDNANNRSAMNRSLYQAEDALDVLPTQNTNVSPATMAIRNANALVSPVNAMVNPPQNIGTSVMMPSQGNDYLFPGQWQVPTVPMPIQINPDGSRDYRFTPGFQKPIKNFKGGGIAGPAKKIYDEDDSTEDIYMVDKEMAEKLGIGRTLEKIAFGRMRYDERIFDQGATAMIDQLIKEGDMERLGVYIASEVATHPDQQQVFATGGKPKKPRNTTNKPFTRTPNQIPILDLPVGANTTDNATTIDPAATRPVSLPNNLPSLPSFVNNLNTQVQQNITPAAALAKKDLEINWENVPDTATTIARLATGAIMSNKQLPRWSPSPQWNAYVADAKRLSQQGLTPEEVAFGEQGIRDSFNTGVANIVRQAGGGGTQGAVLAALGQADAARNNAQLQLASQDAQTRRSNRYLYGNVLGQNEAYLQQQYQGDYANAAATKNAGAQLISSTLSDAEQRRLFEKYNGEGSARAGYMGELQALLASQRAQLNSPLIPAFVTAPGSSSPAYSTPENYRKK